MLHSIIAVYDVKAATYSKPALYPARGAAIRAFMDEINRANQENVLFMHPEDFHLYDFGLFDDNDGTFDLIAKPHLLLTGSEAKSKE